MIDRATRGRWVPAIAAVVAALAYANVLGHGFVYDDVGLVLANPWIRSFGHLREIFTSHYWAFEDHPSSYYRPLPHVLHALLYAATGTAPWAFHALSVALHAASTALVASLALRLGLCRQAALIAGLVFAVHPVHVEAVAWVSSFPDVACAAVSIAALSAFLPARADRAVVRHAFGAAAVLAAALLKEPGITLPAVVILSDVHARPRAPRLFWVTRYGSLLAATAVYLALRVAALRGLVPHASGSTFGLGGAIDTAGVAAWRYLSLLVWPWPLNAFRGLDDATGWPAWLLALGAPALVLAWRGPTRVVVATTLLVVPLLPALFAPALLPGLDNPWAERYLYLPSAGFALLAASGWQSLGARMRRPAAVAGALVLIVLATGTVTRSRVWRDDLTLWSDTVRRSPRAGAPRAYLGWALFSRGEADRAIEQYEIALTLQPNFADAHYNYGVALAGKGLHEAAVRRYHEAIRLNPRDALGRASLALSLTRLGRFEDAQREARQAVELAPRSTRAHAALGVALGEAGRIGEAAQSFRRALALDPADGESRLNLTLAERRLAETSR